MAMTRIALLCLILTGCVARSSHVSVGDSILSDLSRGVASAHPDAPGLAVVADRAARHAASDPAITLPAGLGGGALDIGIGALAALCPAAGAVAMALRRASRERALAERVADLPPDAGRAACDAVHGRRRA